MVINKLFTELFRAKSLDKIVLLPRLENEFKNGLTQNMFLYGPQGSGKTTIARILTAGYDTLCLNGSSENGIDIIRDKVVSFASTISLEFGEEKMKVIYIDEADGLTDAAWDALRETIEHYENSVRYVCTCNKIDKIPAPIKSRFNCVPVYPITKDEETALFNGYCDYVSKILTYFKISFTDETLKEFVKNSFPDMRSILNTIQSLCVQEAKELDRNTLIKTFDCSDLFDVILNGTDPVENYKFVMTNYSSVPDDAMLGISKSFIDYVRVGHPELYQKIPLLVVTIAEYMAQLPTAIDKVIVLLACCFKLQAVIRN